MTETSEIDRVRVGQDEILFRRLTAPVASWSKPGGRWAVEYWARDMGYPLAQAWVSEAYDGYIDWLYVGEEYRRQGIGPTCSRRSRRGGPVWGSTPSPRWPSSSSRAAG